MKKERIEELEQAHQARRKIYGCSSPTAGRKKVLFQEAKRRMMREQKPALRVVRTEDSE